MTKPFSATEFTYCLTRLLRSARLVNWPRRRAQKEVLVASVALMFKSGTNYSEFEVNEHINEWLYRVGKAVELDHVNIRRTLIDEGYVRRDAAGTAYALSASTSELFGDDVAGLDIRQVLANSQKPRIRPNRPKGP